MLIFNLHTYSILQTNLLFSFGSKRVNCTKYVKSITALLQHVDRKVQEVAMDSLVQMYTLEGEKIYKAVSTCEISAAKLKQLKNNFDAVDSGKWSTSMVRLHKRRS